MASALRSRRPASGCPVAPQSVSRTSKTVPSASAMCTVGVGDTSGLPSIS